MTWDSLVHLLFLLGAVLSTLAVIVLVIAVAAGAYISVRNELEKRNKNT